MNPTLGKVLLLGVPLLLSLSWFIFWVVRLMRTAKKLKSSVADSQKLPASGQHPTRPPT